MADHGVLAEVVEDAFEDRECGSVVHLTQNIGQFVLQECVIILETCESHR